MPRSLNLIRCRAVTVCVLITSAASFDRYPRQPGIDELHYTFRIRYSGFFEVHAVCAMRQVRQGSLAARGGWRVNVMRGTAGRAESCYKIGIHRCAERSVSRRGTVHCFVSVVLLSQFPDAISGVPAVRVLGRCWASFL